MHEAAELLITLTAALSVALVLGYLSHRLGLSPIVGYLLAGIAIGPHTPGFTADQHLADDMSTLGVVLLMFGVGLHFHVEDMLAVWRHAVPGAVGHSLAAAALGAAVAWAFGWGWAAGAVYGLALSVASTVVLTRVLSDANELHTPVGRVAVGWLIVEDVFTVVVLVLLPAVFGGGRVQNVPLALVLALLKIAALVAVALLVGGRVIPWLLTRVAASGSRELFTLTVLVVALGIAVGSSMLFGVSMALGAFLAGMVVGRSEFSLRAGTDALPMRDAFAVLFFVSVGMMLNPKFLVEHPGLVAATLAVVLVGKPLIAVVISLVLGYPVRVGLAVAVAMGQIGEFSFILAALGNNLKTAAGAPVLPKEATDALVAAAIVSISLNPPFCRLARPAEAWLARRRALWKWLKAHTQKPGELMESAENDPRHRAVVVGYGPVGRTLVRLLRENGIEPTVIELNLDSVRRLRAEGIHAVYGDATRHDTLVEAGVAGAANLILAASGLTGASEVVRLARELNPEVQVLARASFLKERVALREAGADRVFAGEGEVALAMTESLLRGLGATAEQIDRERERVRTDLFGAQEALGKEDPGPGPHPPAPASEAQSGEEKSEPAS
jgi:CPA2 family monovalent cation:H+ antiporter-2